ncbi:MAG: hypothetical protein JXQ75_17325, partial [Phycisphaerae bacterium]|nr:hypothetical protein [Phycisphaerae bacterium]
MFRRLKLDRVILCLLVVAMCSVLACGAIGDFLDALLGPGGEDSFVGSSVLLRIVNQAGIPTSVEARYLVEGNETRRTSRVLATSGIEAAQTIPWTQADTITVTASVADEAMLSESVVARVGEVITAREYRLGTDFERGSTIEFIVPPYEAPGPDPAPDCNGNRVLDSVDIAEGTSQDCNGNGIPDECDIADATSEDANENGVPDSCENRAC